MLGSLACQFCRVCHYLTTACWIPLQAHTLANASNINWQKSSAELLQRFCLPFYAGAGACKGTQHKMAQNRCNLLSCVAILRWAGACNGTQHKMAKNRCSLPYLGLQTYVGLLYMPVLWCLSVFDNYMLDSFASAQACQRI